MSFIISLPASTRACGSCVFWDGARQVEDDGSCLIVEHASGFCVEPGRVRAAIGILDNITEAGPIDNGCPVWCPIAARQRPGG